MSGQPTAAIAIEKAKKTAVSDGIKRAMRMFGNKMGNSLGDTNYIEKVSSTNPEYIRVCQ